MWPSLTGFGITNTSLLKRMWISPSIQIGQFSSVLWAPCLDEREHFLCFSLCHIVQGIFLREVWRQWNHWSCSGGKHGFCVQLTWLQGTGKTQLILALTPPYSKVFCQPHYSCGRHQGDEGFSHLLRVEQRQTSVQSKVSMSQNKNDKQLDLWEGGEAGGSPEEPPEISNFT